MFVKDLREGPLNVFFHTKHDKMLRESICIGFNGGYCPSKKQLEKIKREIIRITKYSQKDIDIYNKNLDEKNKKYWENYLSINTSNRSKKFIKEIVTDGFVYVIKSEHFYKIGRARNIEERINVYKTENPREMEVITYTKVFDYKKTETELLRKYKHKNHRGRMVFPK